MKQYKTFSNNLYTLKHEWESESFNLEDGHGVLSNGKAFFEVFFENFYFRGEGLTLEEAENKAWNKYQTFLNCDHEYKRYNKINGKCIKCNTVYYDLYETDEKCCKCNNLAYFEGTKNYCSKHYLEKSINELEELKELNSENDEIKEKIYYKEKQINALLYRIEKTKNEFEIFKKRNDLISFEFIFSIYKEYLTDTLPNELVDKIDKDFCNKELVFDWIDAIESNNKDSFFKKYYS